MKDTVKKLKLTFCTVAFNPFKAYIFHIIANLSTDGMVLAKRKQPNLTSRSTLKIKSTKQPNTKKYGIAFHP
ncbi:hypothetical protein HJ202_19130 [Vibrio parahaemolyticus]|uniref:hypothetical protein n=1 Tax=Vibrio parahaemolyticus TaxID=670 RepID=UPI00112401D3|nr:hypothetical protein [Vibrio parahaemolyticus]MBE3722441.1 hypothetical protein [Vibrio parahaemolyticus]HCE3682802.1 hypothetical protein [Vibrio parahaemolyticus]HCE4562475.1 hypothetical protein [Vibrio parahaemolyticus]HCE4895696.1 hypothetical protein [Vibrio parahaemolyticus]HCG6664081.1 hypothetical protein [Vibrio parahaemolyticus]